MDRRQETKAAPPSTRYFRWSRFWKRLDWLPALLLFAATVHAQQRPAQPWMDPALPAKQRAHLALQAMILDEKLQLVHGTGWGVLRDGDPIAPGHNGGAGFVQGIPLLHKSEEHTSELQS